MSTEEPDSLSDDPSGEISISVSSSCEVEDISLDSSEIDDRISSISVSSDFELTPLSNENVSDKEEELDESASRKRRKRGAFKGGLLRRSKKGRSQPETEMEVTEDQSEDYYDMIEQLLSEDPSADCGSVSESFPSEGDRTITETESHSNTEVSSEPEPGKHFSRRGRKRRKRPLGKQEKYSWKKAKDTTDEDIMPTHIDIGCSANPIDIAAEALMDSQPNESLHTVVNYLKLTLDSCWAVSNINETINICRLTNPENPVVERAITWSEGKVHFFVFNQQLHENHRLWEIRPRTATCAEVADYLTSIAIMFMEYEVCSGVHSNQHLWEKYSKSGDGITSYNLEIPNIRSKDCCLLLTYPTKCSCCRQLQRKMEEHLRQKGRTAAKKNVDQSKINNRYLQRDEIEAKTKRIKKEKKMSKQTIKRLERRMKQLIEQRSERIESELSDDFVQIMNSNTEKMTAIEKLFWSQQSIALSKRGKSRTMRWHPAMIRLALHIRMLSPAAFDFLSGVLCLPSSRRLFDYSQFVDIQEGIQEELLDQLKSLIQEKCKNEYEQYFSLLIDEMSIRSNLVYSSRTGQLIGFTNLTSLEDELASLEEEIAGKVYEKKLAKKFVVFMLNGCANPILFPIAIYSTDDLQSYHLYTRTWDVIYAVEEARAKVLVVLFDGASINRKFVRMHFNMGSKDYVYFTLNSASGEPRLIYFMLDPVHLLKTFRNCLANSFSHRKSRELFNNEEKLSWKAIEALFEICQKHKYGNTKLTKAHVTLTSFSCMKVIFAVQVLSLSVAEALHKWKDVSPLKEHYSEELVNFVKIMNRWFDCMNGGEKSQKKDKNPDLQVYASPEDPRFDFLEKQFITYLEDWENYVAARFPDVSKEKRARMTISYQSVEGIKITVSSFVAVCKFLLGKGAPSVSSRNFNQDPLEQYSSDLRRAGGDNNNPTLKAAMHTRLSLLAQGQCFSRSKHGNTEVQKRHLEVDNSPAPVRSKK